MFIVLGNMYIVSGHMERVKKGVFVQAHELMVNNRILIERGRAHRYTGITNSIMCLTGEPRGALASRRVFDEEVRPWLLICPRSSIGGARRGFERLQRNPYGFLP